MELWQRFTSRARRAVLLAHGEASRTRAQLISTEHLLLGLLRTGEGTAYETLDRLGVDIDRLRADLERQMEIGVAEEASSEISFNPDPPVAGVPGQICIQLQNPLSVSKVVTVNFSVADFGAGIGFTPATSLTNITLPAHSLNTYCASWTPATSGTLHRCVLAILVQAGALEQTSQHNVEIVRPTSSDLRSLVIPFVVGNPGQAARNLTFDINLVGINPLWLPAIQTPAGGAPPTSLAGGGQVSLVLRFGLGSGAASSILAPQLPLIYSSGSRSSVEVTELLDGTPESGFSVYLVRSVYLPLIIR